MIFADVGVKYAAPLADCGLAIETRDLAERGMADAIIVSGELTGAETKTEDVDIVRKNTSLPILIGSGATPENLHKVYSKVDGVIAGVISRQMEKETILWRRNESKASLKHWNLLNAGSRRRIDLALFIAAHITINTNVLSNVTKSLDAHAAWYDNRKGEHCPPRPGCLHSLFELQRETCAPGISCGSASGMVEIKRHL